MRCLVWLLCFAVGAVLVTAFNHSLDRSLDQLALTSEVRAQIDAARLLLATARNPNPMVQRAINKSSVNGYTAKGGLNSSPSLKRGKRLPNLRFPTLKRALMRRFVNQSDELLGLRLSRK
jgi:hypothetical protein